MSKKTKDSRVLNCNLDRILYEKLAKSAFENDRTVTAELERILRIHFKSVDAVDSCEVSDTNVISVVS